MAILRIPALIDPHFHMIESSPEHWLEVARIARAAGYWAIQIMPDFDLPIADKMTIAHYQQQLPKTGTSLLLTAAATPDNIQDLKQFRSVNAIKVWLGTGPEELIVAKEEELRQILLSTEKVVMVHAEDESTLLRNYSATQSQQELELGQHSFIFDRKAAIRATVKALAAAKETGRRIYICHISTAEEVELIRRAKEKQIRVYAEVAPHHLFLTEEDLDRLELLGKVNPPLRTTSDQEALWEAMRDGTIDTIGSDNHAWLEQEKIGYYEEVPSGLPNFELTLPLLLTAVRDKRLSLQRAIELTSSNPARIFSIPKPTRSLFVDIDTPRPIRTHLNDWHPYPSEQLVGWPIRQKEGSPA